MRKGVGSFVRQLPGRTEGEGEVSDGGFPSISSLSHVQKCYDFRIALEGDAAFFAARNRSEKDLTLLRDALGQLEEAIAAANLGTDADYDFHATVAHCSENPFFVKAARMMREPVRIASICRGAFAGPTPRLGFGSYKPSILRSLRPSRRATPRRLEARCVRTCRTPAAEYSRVMGKISRAG